MSPKSKQLSNPFSTGGGGPHFEAYVQAYFVVLMLTGGFAPGMPSWPITKIKLQGKFLDFDTDDLIIFIEQAGSGEKRKILGQIKHAIRFSGKDQTFGEVILAAWNDFNNSNLFNQGKDTIALITGPLSSSDINDVRTILEWARYSENADEFIKKVGLTKFSSNGKLNKLKAFRTSIDNANGGIPVSDQTLFDFLRHFHLLGYDLDVKAGVTLSFLHSLIGQFSQENAFNLWTRLVDEVQHANKYTGTISPDMLPEDLRIAFSQRHYAVFPKEIAEEEVALTKPDWNQLPYASDLAIINLIGSWHETNETDREIIRQLSNEEYPIWIKKVKEVLQLPNSPVSLKNGRWRVNDRTIFWEALGGRLFDDNLKTFKALVAQVLSEHDPQFNLPFSERFAAINQGKTLKHSSELRSGMAESLALLGNKPNELTNCSQGKPENTAARAVYDILQNADWVLWGSLNHLLPLFAEAAPKPFLSLVEGALQQSPSPFDEIFTIQGKGITGENYLTGLIWALETLAWEEQYFVKACVLLGELAAQDPGGSWSIRPANSLVVIFLPWLPQTLASIEKRKAALTTLQKEFPEVAWALLINLISNKQTTSSGTRKPKWHISLPNDLKSDISRKDYLEQVTFFVDLAISMAKHDMEKLKELTKYLEKFPPSSFDNFLEYLSDEAIINLSDEARFPLWSGLTDLYNRHSRYPNARWAMKIDRIEKIEDVSNKLAPNNPIYRHLMLFNGPNIDLYEGSGGRQDLEQKLQERRQQAVQEVLNISGIKGVIQLADNVEFPSKVGFSLGVVAPPELDQTVFPRYLLSENQSLLQLTTGFVSGRARRLGWNWVDGLDKSSWSVSQISSFLSFLPFTDETWNRVTKWLGDAEGEYWNKVTVSPYQADDHLRAAIDKLIKYGRPYAAIDCIFRWHYEEQPLDNSQSVKALLAAVSSAEPPHTINTHHIIEIIKALQNSPDIDPEALFQVEWAYLPLLYRNGGIPPRNLELRLGSDANFYSDTIRLIYRSKKEDKPKTEFSDKEKSIALNAYTLLNEWRIPPGTQPDDSFSGELFSKWLEKVKALCAETGHLEIALSHVGQVLINCPPDSEGLWINFTVADALNARDAEYMRHGFSIGLFNSRGGHTVDPTGNLERELAEQYRQKAETIENAGYYRLASTLRELADSYESDANRIATEQHRLDIDN